MYKQYGKQSAALLMQKKSFFEENEKHILKQREIVNIYIKQAERLLCKNCEKTLSSTPDFIKDRIPYKICSSCTHLNGSFEDSDEFCEQVYTSNDGKSYAQNYDSKDLENYNYRVSSIYIPKAEFLYTSLKNINENPHALKYLDFGSGAGYFVSALSKIGIQEIEAFEVSKSQVELGNKMIGKDLLSLHCLSESEKVLSETRANVVSMIGVLEHLQHPRKAIESILKNENIQYLYVSVPLFSLSVYFGMMSDDIFHRQLHGGHTHLYTEESLKHLSDEFDLEIIAEWWFGQDVVDLYRNLLINLEGKSVSDNLKNHYKKMMCSFMDSVQLEIDKKHYSSEVHMLLKKRCNG
jgi:hypothetical protein